MDDKNAGVRSHNHIIGSDILKWDTIVLSLSKKYKNILLFTRINLKKYKTRKQTFFSLRNCLPTVKIEVKDLFASKSLYL